MCDLHRWVHPGTIICAPREHIESRTRSLPSRNCAIWCRTSSLGNCCSGNWNSSVSFPNSNSSPSSSPHLTCAITPLLIQFFKVADVEDDTATSGHAIIFTFQSSTLTNLATTTLGGKYAYESLPPPPKPDFVHCQPKQQRSEAVISLGVEPETPLSLAKLIKQLYYIKHIGVTKVPLVWRSGRAIQGLDASRSLRRGVRSFCVGKNFPMRGPWLSNTEIVLFTRFVI